MNPTQIQKFNLKVISKWRICLTAYRLLMGYLVRKFDTNNLQTDLFDPKIHSTDINIPDRSGPGSNSNKGITPSLWTSRIGASPSDAD